MEFTYFTTAFSVILPPPICLDVHEFQILNSVYQTVGHRLLPGVNLSSLFCKVLGERDCCFFLCCNTDSNLKFLREPSISYSSIFVIVSLFFCYMCYICNALKFISLIRMSTVCKCMLIFICTYRT